MELRPAIFLDRDGVLNHTQVIHGKPFAPRKFEDFHIFPDIIPVLNILKQKGYLLIVITNQPDVGNGIVEKTIIESMNSELLKVLPLDGIKVCYHAQSDNCYCRKPKPGMLLDAANEFKIDLGKSIMVGDRDSDIAAGCAAGCRTVFLNYQYEEARSQIPNFVIKSLSDIVDIISNKI